MYTISTISDEAPAAIRRPRPASVVIMLMIIIIIIVIVMSC